MGKVIVITSGKGGVGKTTSAANIGCALAQEEKSVVLLDADVGLRNLDVVMGLEDRIVYDFVDVLEAGCRLSQALVKDKRFDNLYMIAASQTKDKSDVDTDKMKRLTKELAEKFDYVIIDCPAGIEHGFKTAVAGADEAIVIATPERSSVRDADRILGRLEALGMKKTQIVINKVKPSMIRKGSMLGIDETIEILASPLLGIVPYDDLIFEAACKGESVVKTNKSRAGQAYKNIAKRINGEKIPLMDLEDERTLRYRIKRVFSRK